MKRPPPRQVTLTKETIARELQYLLDMPQGTDTNIRACKAYKLVTTIVKVMTKALQRGEKITVRGLGTFVLCERPPILKRLHYFYRDKGNYSKLVMMPTKYHVKFKPCGSLKRYVNSTQSTVGDPNV